MHINMLNMYVCVCISFCFPYISEKKVEKNDCVLQTENQQPLFKHIQTIKRSSVKKTDGEKLYIVHKELTESRCSSVKRREKMAYSLLNPLKI